MHTTQTLAPQPRSTSLAGWKIPPKGHCTHPGNLLTRRSRRPQAQGSDWSTPASAPHPRRVGLSPVTDPGNLDCSRLVPPGPHRHPFSSFKVRIYPLRVPKRRCPAAPQQMESSCPNTHPGLSSQSGLINNLDRQASVKRHRRGRVSGGVGVGGGVGC